MRLTRSLVTLGAWTLGAAGAIVALRLLAVPFRWLDRAYGPGPVITFEVLRLAFPVAGALLLAQWLQTRPRFTTQPRWLVTLCSWVVGALGGTGALHGLFVVFRWLDEGFGTSRTVADALSVALAIACALFLARWVHATAPRAIAQRISSLPVRRAVAALFLGLYLATWAFGVPAATTHLISRDLAAYKRAYAGNDRIYWERYPRLGASFGAPLLPGLILVYYESQLGGQWGAGGWYIFAWWALDERPLSFHPRWLS